MGKFAKGILEKDFESFEKEFDRASKKAVGKISRRVGKKMVRQRLKQLAGQSGRRKDGVTYRVTKNGYLVLLDLAPMAEAQEFGRVILPDTAKYLRVPIGREHRGGGPRKDHVVIESNGQLLLMRKKGRGELEPVATLRRKVVIKRSARSGRFSTVVEKNLKSYREELEAALAKEML